MFATLKSRSLKYSLRLQNIARHYYYINISRLNINISNYFINFRTKN